MKTNINRRSFIRQASCAAIGGTTFMSTLMNLKALNAASIFNSSIAYGDDYKALICLFKSGGNDSFNMLIPTTANEYVDYAASRSNLAIDNSLNLNVQNTPGRTFGIHPSLPGMQEMFNDGALSFIANVGTLIEPINRDEFYNGLKKVPLGLYSHADQAQHWQTSVPHGRVSTGWGGKISDILQAANSNQKISMSMSLSGSNVFQTGNQTVEYALDPYDGSRGILEDNEDWLLNSVRHRALNSMVDVQYQDIFKQSYKEVIRISREGNVQFQEALTNPPSFNTPFSDNYLSQSFHMAAKVIAAREELGMRRQIFFIDYGGWDHHDEVLDAQNEMFGEVDGALFQFNAAMKQLELADCVTTFTISEFGRTLTSNGNGTDHGWGGNVSVMGGAVNGGNIFGEYPSLKLDNPLDIGSGVFIPTTSPDEYFAELALWFGVPNTDLNMLFPNLSNFYSIGGSNPIGFLEY